MKNFSVPIVCHSYPLGRLAIAEQFSWLNTRLKRRYSVLGANFTSVPESFGILQGLSNHGKSREPSSVQRKKVSSGDKLNETNHFFLNLRKFLYIHLVMSKNSEESSTSKACTCSCRTLEKRCPTQILCKFPSSIFCNSRKTLLLPENKEMQITYKNIMYSPVFRSGLFRCIHGYVEWSGM